MAKINIEEQKILDEHFIKCHYSYAYFAQCNQKIQDEDNELVPFYLKDTQIVLEEIWEDIVKSGRRIRLWMLKGRKQHFSSWAVSKSHWLITAKGKFKKTANGPVFNGLVRNQNMSVIAHDPKTTAYLYEMFKRMDAAVQPELQQDKLKCNGYMIHYDNVEKTGLDSMVMLGSADTQDCGSGMTLTISLRDELAKWPAENTASLLLSLDNAIPDSKNTVVFNISTAKGVGNAFHTGFLACRYVYEVAQDKEQNPYWTLRVNENSDEDNEASSVFLPWYISLKYRRPPRPDFKRTLEEEEWVKTYNLCDEQLAWYRWALQQRCSGDKAKRRQEYPMNAREAFISSGEPAFDVPTILRLKSICEEKENGPIARYDCLISSGNFISKTDGAIKVWKEPDNQSHYVISADVAEGLLHGDFHSASVLDHDTGEQVAHYHGKMEPWNYAALLMALGYRYNEAWLIPERNNHGGQVIQEFLKKDYPNIYQDMKEEPGVEKGEKKFGWLTVGQGDRKKQALIDNGKKIISEGNPGINDPLTYEEMLNFKRQADGKERADNGTFDDCVMDWLIGRWILSQDYLPYATRTRKVNHGPGGSRKTGKGKKTPDKLAYY